MHKITFTLGDYGGDGHGMCKVYHMSANYSAEEIDEAYKQATAKLKFDFIKEVASQYGDYGVVIPQYAKILADFKIINRDKINASDEDSLWGDSSEGCYDIDGKDEYLDIFVDIIRLILPDFYWEYRDLGEEHLECLQGACYGMFDAG